MKLKLKNYRIIKKIGHGGMGLVYVAEDLALGRLVALKVLAPYLVQDPEILERFRFEARNQAQLMHANITMVYSFLVEDEQAFLVLEFIDGETLESRINREGRIVATEALPIFRKILDALEYAHSKGMIHRDIKPGNIAFTSEGHVKIMDFGIALNIEATGRLTKTGHILGTPHYMAPEQILGQELTFRTDIYALGITLFEMITGRLPFDSKSDFEVRVAQINHSPPSLLSFGYPDISPELEEVIFKALAKEPEARFPSAKEFLRALEAAVGRDHLATIVKGRALDKSTLVLKAKSEPAPPRPEPEDEAAPEPSPAEVEEVLAEPVPPPMEEPLGPPPSEAEVEEATASPEEAEMAEAAGAAAGRSRRAKQPRSRARPRSRKSWLSRFLHRWKNRWGRRRLRRRLKRPRLPRKKRKWLRPWRRRWRSRRIEAAPEPSPAEVEEVLAEPVPPPLEEPLGPPPSEAEVEEAAASPEEAEMAEATGIAAGRSRRMKQPRSRARPRSRKSWPSRFLNRWKSRWGRRRLRRRLKRPRLPRKKRKWRRPLAPPLAEPEDEAAPEPSPAEVEEVLAEPVPPPLEEPLGPPPSEAEVEEAAASPAEAEMAEAAGAAAGGAGG